MPGPSFVYELWNGQEVVGHYTSDHELFVELVVFTAYSQTERNTIRCRIIERVEEQNYCNRVLRKVIDVRKKSKRQIAFLCGRR